MRTHASIHMHIHVPVFFPGRDVSISLPRSKFWAPWNAGRKRILHQSAQASNYILKNMVYTWAGLDIRTNKQRFSALTYGRIMLSSGRVLIPYGQVTKTEQWKLVVACIPEDDDAGWLCLHACKHTYIHAYACLPASIHTRMQTYIRTYGSVVH